MTVTLYLWWVRLVSVLLLVVSVKLGLVSEGLVARVAVEVLVGDGSGALCFLPKVTPKAGAAGQRGTYLGVSNFQRAISMVIPRSRSDFSLSRTHAYLKEPLPSSAASFSNCWWQRAMEGCRV